MEGQVEDRDVLSTTPSLGSDQSRTPNHPGKFESKAIMYPNGEANSVDKKQLLFGQKPHQELNYIHHWTQSLSQNSLQYFNNVKHILCIRSLSGV